MFESLYETLSPSEYEWPEDGAAQRQLLRNADCYLETDGTVTPIRSFRTVDQGEFGVALPSRLVEILRLLERARLGPAEPDLGAQLGDEDIDQMWELLCDHAERAADRGLLEEFPGFDRLNGWETVVVIAHLIADGMEYTRLPIQDELLTDEPTDHWLEDATDGVASWRRWVEQAELSVASALSFLTRDLRSVTSLVERILEVGMRGLCRHYSTVVQTLFYTVKRATDRFEDEHVVTLVGRPHPTAPYGHAWNWYCDAKSNLVVAFDLTGADRLLDTGRSMSMFNHGFDGYRWANASAFVNTAALWYATPDGPLTDEPDVRDYLGALVDPETPHGKALLYNLCLQPGVDDRVRDRIVEFLERRNFGDSYPAWRITLTACTSLLNMDAPDGALDPQFELCDAMIES